MKVGLTFHRFWLLSSRLLKKELAKALLNKAHNVIVGNLNFPHQK
ncbi:Hypothetical protein LDBND_1689 [Lactobacillus delbrueckii subsp. bulgaricus ND02]|nr:Hypothetical protein LDBND_1689 [Lactobacillus delbrueckii subsp. bulgaricus ND02]